jgi:hypothetical protein
MGIPLDGTINQFQSKLLGKGFKLDAATNSVIGAGCRVFTGIFSGEDAEIYVFFNTKTNIVYRAKAVIDYPNITTAERGFENFKNSLSKKYSDCSVGHGDEEEGYPAYMLVINDEDMNTVGVIATYVSCYSVSLFEDRYCLQLDYMDSTNLAENSDENFEDL